MKTASRRGRPVTKKCNNVIAKVKQNQPTNYRTKHLPLNSFKLFEENWLQKEARSFGRHMNYGKKRSYSILVPYAQFNRSSNHRSRVILEIFNHEQCAKKKSWSQRGKAPPFLAESILMPMEATLYVWSDWTAIAHF